MLFLQFFDYCCEAVTTITSKLVVSKDAKMIRRIMLIGKRKITTLSLSLPIGCLCLCLGLLRRVLKVRCGRRPLNYFSRRWMALQMDVLGAGRKAGRYHVTIFTVYDPVIGRDKLLLGAKFSFLCFTTMLRWLIVRSC